MTRPLFFILAILSGIITSTAASRLPDIKHPSLLFTPQRVEAARQRIATDSMQAAAWQSIKTRADKLVDDNDVRSLEYLALAYQMTGERQYSDKIRDMLVEVSQTPSWSDREMMMRNPPWRSELQMAHKAFQLAVAYDAVYNDLTHAQRTAIAGGLYRLAVEPLLGDWLVEPTRIHSLNSMGHNWWSSCVGMGALLGLAISNEVPEAARGARAAVEALPEWFCFAGDAIQAKPKSFDDGGGMYESINYASFGITEALLLRMAWINSHPGDRLEPLPQIELLPEFFCHVAYPRSGMLYSINFGDSHKNVTGEGSMFLTHAMGVKSAATLWYATQVTPGQHREGMPRHFPMGFLYTPDLTDAPDRPGLATSKIWHDFGWATMRDSWDRDATMLAVKSGMTWNHSHADANSLILFHKGVDIIKDAGNCSYGKPEYRNYFFQSDAHNVVKFDGHGQPRAQQYHGSPLPGSIHNLLDSRRTKYVMADGTGPMSHMLSRNFRHFLWTGRVILVIDDIKSHEPGQFQWLWHPGGEVRKTGGDLVITEGDASVVIRPLYPQPLAPSNFVHDYPEMMYWEILDGPVETLDGTEQYWSLHLPLHTDRIKGVTAIMLKDSPDQTELPEIERREGKDWIGLRITDRDKVTDLYINQLADGRLMHLNSWIDADGWTTDAYMLAVTYSRGADVSAPDEMFMAHGSSVRRGSDVHFSSLAKLNIISSVDGDTLDVQVNGQPRLNFGLKAPRTARRLTVNGQPQQLIKDADGLARIKRHQ